MACNSAQIVPHSPAPLLPVIPTLSDQVKQVLQVVHVSAGCNLQVSIRGGLQPGEVAIRGTATSSISILLHRPTLVEHRAALGALE